jgi:DNA-binding XRE family transcriptional regulator
MQSTTEMLADVSVTGAPSGVFSARAFPINWNNAFLTAVFLAGTGGVANPQTINRAQCGPISVRVMDISQEGAPADRLLDIQEKLAGIRRYLSMNVTNMAKTLRVARPTVYSWLRDEPSLRGNHLLRLEALYKIARGWRKISSQPVGEFLAQPLPSGESLLALLSAKTLNEAEIQDAFVQIHKTVSRSLGRESIVDVARTRGFKPVAVRPASHWSSNEDVDL